MSYTKTTWSDGDVITAEKLNNIENGVESASSGSILVVHVVNGVLDKTWQEICDSFINMIPVYCYESFEDGNDFGYMLSSVQLVSFENNTYYVFAYGGIEYTTTSPSGYPGPSNTDTYWYCIAE